MGLPFDYELGDRALEVKLGPFTVRSIEYSDMEEVRNGHPFWNEHWTNFWPFRFLTIRRRTRRWWWPHDFVINPPDRDAFADELRRRIQQVRP